MTRVGLLGNMNNNHFAVARYLRDRGVDAHVLLFDNEFEHFHPSCDAHDEEWRKYVHQLTWGSVPRYLLTPARKLRADLEPYDLLVGTALAPAYCAKADRTLDVFVPCGGDIWTMLGKAAGNPLRFAKYVPTMRAQARGIRNARVFHMSPTNELYERQWARYRGRSERWREGVPMVYDRAYGPEQMPTKVARSPHAPAFQAARDAADLMLFSSARHFWKCPPSHPAAKGTHRLLQGIALFREKHPDCRVVLATFEYGQQVAASKALARELGIEDCVRWFPTMQRKDLMLGLGLADVACGEFENSWITSGVLYEAMALGKPILAHRDDSLYRDGETQLYDIMNAKEPEEISAQLDAYWREPSHFRVMGERGREWYQTNVVAKPLDKYIALVRGREAQ